MNCLLTRINCLSARIKCLPVCLPAGIRWKKALRTSTHTAVSCQPQANTFDLTCSWRRPGPMKD
jgi:hypothetical protein